jgi:hypothetical protein
VEYDVEEGPDGRTKAINVTGPSGAAPLVRADVGAEAGPAGTARMAAHSRPSAWQRKGPQRQGAFVALALHGNCFAGSRDAARGQQGAFSCRGSLGGSAQRRAPRAVPLHLTGGAPPAPHPLDARRRGHRGGRLEAAAHPSRGHPPAAAAARSAAAAAGAGQATLALQRATSTPLRGMGTTRPAATTQAHTTRPRMPSPCAAGACAAGAGGASAAAAAARAARRRSPAACRCGGRRGPRPLRGLAKGRGTGLAPYLRGRLLRLRPSPRCRNQLALVQPPTRRGVAPYSRWQSGRM